MTKLIAVLKMLRPDLGIENNWFSTYERGGNSIVPAIYDQSTNRLMQGDEAFDFILSLMCQRVQTSRPPIYNMNPRTEIVNPSGNTVQTSPSSVGPGSNATPPPPRQDLLLPDAEFGEHVNAKERKLSPECMAKLFSS